MVSRHSFGKIPAGAYRSPLIRARLCALGALLAGAVACGVSPPQGQEGGSTGGVKAAGGGNTGGNANAGGTKPDFVLGTTGGTQSTGGAPTAATGGSAVPVCGNGTRDSVEACDDGNTSSGDGCTSDCSAVEPNYACPNPGQSCVLTVVCGDKKITGAETCDDGNTARDDGCSDTCELEHGWACPVMGAACRAAKCGDGVLVGTEVCDDGNATSGDGCSSTCRLEAGWLCTTAGEACTKTVCGDHVTEGTEECDDGNLMPYDGCSPTCTIEPKCENGSCTAICGDGLRFPQEGCDDGNTRSGDGCNSDCQEETGYKCDDTAETPPASLAIPILYRDFLYDGTPATSDHPAGHPDFEHPEYAPGGACMAVTSGLVAAQLGADGKPTFLSSVGDNACHDEITSADSFASWYQDAPLNIAVASTLTLSKQTGTATYAFSSTSFFPLDGLGWQNATYCSGSTPTTTDCQTNVPTPNTTSTPSWCSQWASQCSNYGTVANSGHNFSFTSELRYPFTYQGGEVFSFTGDDDVWAFVNGMLAVDLGGIHVASSKTITLDAAAAQTYGLTVGGMYEIALFQAERHVTQSNYKLTLAGFDHTTSVCKSYCGDGIVTPDEACDLGKDGNTGEYGTCNPDCTLAPYCGDGQTQSPEEQCDDIVHTFNLATYGYNGNSQACGPNCQYAPYCGDAKVDGLFGEQCDDGNTVSLDGCESNCMIGTKCGNGVVDADVGEDCDDGNTISGDGCSQFCIREPTGPA